MDSQFPNLTQLIDDTRWVDCHEHLVEEQGRLTDDLRVLTDGSGEAVGTIPADWTALLQKNALDHLVTAGLPPASASNISLENGSAVEKWDLVSPYFELARITGSLRSVDISTERLFQLKLSRDTCEEIDQRLRDLRKPGYYREVLRDLAGVEEAQVNTVESDPFCDTKMPDLLKQDLAISDLVRGRHPGAERASGIEVGTLDDYLNVVEWCFDQFGNKAVAVKCWWAYWRPLAVTDLDAPPRKAFSRLLSNTEDLADRRAVEDFLFLRSLALATEHGLPVKLHTGYLGPRTPHLRWVGHHISDLVPLVHAHPKTNFVLLHTAWPTTEEAISLAKHFPNVIIDMSYSWNGNPVAAKEFVRRFLTTVPANKLLCFGGDYFVVEQVVGHAEMARRGLEGALVDLITGGWLSEDEALTLVPHLMSGNARRIFPDRPL